MTPIVSIRNLSKTFSGTRVLRSVDLDVLPGEVHGLLGQNGSGKSTLIKLLSGVNEPDDGAVLEINGEAVDLPMAPGESRRRGIGFLHQDLALIPSLSILENLRTDGFLTRFGARIDWKRERLRARTALQDLGLSVDPMMPVATLSAAERAIVALARSLDEISEVQRGLLVLDEPTAYLPRGDVEQLFAAVRETVGRGSGVLFVSHRLDEVFAICDRVTVLRDGKRVGTVRLPESSEAEIMHMIVGRQLEALEPHEPVADAEVVLKVRGLSGAVAADVSLDLRRGEVLGLTGLVGMGHDEMPYLLMGATRATSGQVMLGDKELDLTPRAATRAGMVLLPADRTDRSGVGSESVAANVSLPVLGSYYRGGRLHRGAERRDARALMERFGVRPPSPERLLGTLSGGNQQKALLAKWLQLSPKVLILHEPTQGIDVGARMEVISNIRAAAAEGVSVLVVSSEAEDLEYLCDRIHVFQDGRIESTLTGSAITKDRIIERCYVAARPS